MTVGGRVHTVTHNEAPASAAQDVVHLQHPHVVYLYLLQLFSSSFQFMQTSLQLFSSLSYLVPCRPKHLLGPVVEQRPCTCPCSLPN